MAQRAIIDDSSRCIHYSGCNNNFVLVFRNPFWSTENTYKLWLTVDVELCCQGTAERRYPFHEESFLKHAWNKFMTQMDPRSDLHGSVLPQQIPESLHRGNMLLPSLPIKLHLRPSGSHGNCSSPQSISCRTGSETLRRNSTHEAGDGWGSSQFSGNFAIEGIIAIISAFYRKKNSVKTVAIPWINPPHSNRYMSILDDVGTFPPILLLGWKKEERKPNVITDHDQHATSIGFPTSSGFSFFSIFLLGHTTSSLKV